MNVSLPELQTIIAAAIVIVATGFLTKFGERLFEWADERLHGRRRD